MQRTPVLIVGGSLVGLSASLFLSWRGVPHVLVERHLASSPHPRAMGFTPRTLEAFRAVGIGSRIPQVEQGWRLRRARVASLAGERIGETAWTPGQDAPRKGMASPCFGAAIAQDKLEPLLRAATLELGSSLRLGGELVSFDQDASAVTAHVRDRGTGEESEIRADYLIAADGADSKIRDQLGIPRHGVGPLQVLRSVLFRCVGADAYLASGFQQFEIEQADFRAFLTTYGDGRWVLMFDDDSDRATAELEDAVLRALGKDLPFEIITTGRWELAGRIAERYARGRVFLAGDAAHQLPPTRGGYGANTGIDDAWNLAWKLQRVVNGSSEPALLDTYSDERQPIGWLRHQQTFARPDYARWVEDPLVKTTIYDDEAMELGQLMRSSVIVGAGSKLPPAATPEDWAGQPGTRAPHAWITQGESAISTLDLFGPAFVLLSADQRWVDAAREVEAADRVGLVAMLVGHDIRFAGLDDFERQFGVPGCGATLVRPDGVVCWRSGLLPVEGWAACLREVMRTVAMPRQRPAP